MRNFLSGLCATALATSVALAFTAITPSPSLARGGGMGGVMVHGGGMHGGWGGGMRGGWGGGGWGHAAWARPGGGWGHAGWGRPGWGHAAWGHPGWGRPGWGRAGWGHPGWRNAGWGWRGRGWGWRNAGWGWGNAGWGCGWGWGGCGNDFFWPAAGFVTGAVVGSAVADSYYSPYYYQPVAYGGSHAQWCYHRYRSYRSSDNTFQPRHGPRQQCISPYGY